MADANPAKAKPRIAAVGENPQSGSGAATDRPPVAESGEGRRRVSRGLFGLLAALLLVSAVGLAIQGRRIDQLQSRVQGLEGQVEGLTVQLSAAHTQLQFYDMHFGLVRESVSDLVQRLSTLHELVREDPMASPRPQAPETP